MDDREKARLKIKGLMIDASVDVLKSSIDMSIREREMLIERLERLHAKTIEGLA